jgi:hypothetical protein
LESVQMRFNNTVNRRRHSFPFPESDAIAVTRGQSEREDFVPRNNWRLLLSLLNFAVLAGRR